MRNNSCGSNDLFRAVDGYTRAMTALMSMPARWACDFTSAFESAACRPRSSGCCDPCPPKCESSCEDQCCDPCEPCSPPPCDPCQTSACGCGDPCCSKCGHKSVDPCHTNACGCGDPCCSKCGHKSVCIEKDCWVELRSGQVGIVEKIEDCFVTINGNKYAKSSVRRMRRPLEDKSRVRTTSGLVGTVKDYIAGDRFLTIASGTMTFEIDRCAICEVLPPKGSPTQESKGDDSKGKSKGGGT